MSGDRLALQRVVFYQPCLLLRYHSFHAIAIKARFEKCEFFIDCPFGVRARLREQGGDRRVKNHFVGERDDQGRHGPGALVPRNLTLVPITQEQPNVELT